MHADDVEQLESLKDVAHRLFPDEGGRVQTGGRMGGKLNAFLGSLLPSNFCRTCGACYYRPECVIGDPNLVKLGRGFRDAFRKILKEREGERDG